MAKVVNVAESSLAYPLLGASVVLNLLLLFKIRQLRSEVHGVRGGVALSREELEQLKQRMARLKKISE